jgi:hypothetical protein
MPVTLPILFCSPQDVWDLLGTEGVDLREDDHSLASGQIVQTTTDSPVGSTSIAVAFLPVALLKGAQLEFEGAGMSIPVQVQLSSAAAQGATTISVLSTATDIPAGAQARDSGVNAATGARLLVGARKGTSKVKLYCNQRYDDSQLVQSGSVLDWAAICAAKFLCTRRAQGCPAGIAEDYEEVMEELRLVQSGQLAIEGIGTRGIDWPTVSNVTVNPGYDGMRARVEPNISEQTATAYSQYIDWNSAVILDF